MFNPHDFFKISENLFDAAYSESSKILTLNKCEEALLRTIVTRAYYAVYLTCREWLNRNFGIDLNKEAREKEKSVHSILLEIMWDRTQRQYLIDFIRELKIKREMCDYDLKIQIEKSDARRSILIAKDILDEIKI